MLSRQSQKRQCQHFKGLIEAFKNCNAKNQEQLPGLHLATHGLIRKNCSERGFWKKKQQQKTVALCSKLSRAKCHYKWRWRDGSSSHRTKDWLKCFSPTACCWTTESDSLVLRTSALTTWRDYSAAAWRSLRLQRTELPKRTRIQFFSNKETAFGHALVTIHALKKASFIYVIFTSHTQIIDGYSYLEEKDKWMSWVYQLQTRSLPQQLLKSQTEDLRKHLRWRVTRLLSKNTFP